MTCVSKMVANNLKHKNKISLPLWQEDNTQPGVSFEVHDTKAGGGGYTYSRGGSRRLTDRQTPVREESGLSRERSRRKGRLSPPPRGRDCATGLT